MALKQVVREELGAMWSSRHAAMDSVYRWEGPTPNMWRGILERVDARSSVGPPPPSPHHQPQPPPPCYTHQPHTVAYISWKCVSRVGVPDVCIKAPNR